jgi:hypothetical protein
VILRDLSTLLVITYYTHQVMKEGVQPKVNEDDISAFMDFDMMLVSVLPHKYFISFLQEDKITHLPYLQLIHLYKLYSDEMEQLTEIEMEIARCTNITASSVSSVGLKGGKIAKKTLKLKEELLKKIESRRETSFAIVNSNKALFSLSRKELLAQLAA